MTTTFKKFPKRLALVAGLSMLCASGAFAQSTATATANSTASIVRPIAITSTADMAFGNIVADATSPGTATMGFTGTVTYGNTYTSPGNQNGTRSAAGFTVTGEGGFTFAITLPTTAQTLTETGGATLSLDTFLSSVGATSSLTGTGAGSKLFTVGATLHIPAGQTPGSYTGTFDVTVAYN